MGCVNIIDHSKLLFYLGYHAWVHYVPIALSDENPDEPWPSSYHLVQTVNLLKRYPDLAREIALKAESHTLQSHTYFHRAWLILNAVGIQSLDQALDNAIQCGVAEVCGDEQTASTSGVDNPPISFSG